jgi:hypothetical protein
MGGAGVFACRVERRSTVFRVWSLYISIDLVGQAILCVPSVIPEPCRYELQLVRSSEATFAIYEMGDLGPAITEIPPARA